MTVKRTQRQHRFLVQVAGPLLTGLILVSQSTRLPAGLLTKQMLLALLKASSQGTRDDELPLAGLEAEVNPKEDTGVGKEGSGRLLCKVSSLFLAKREVILAKQILLWSQKLLKNCE